MPEVSWLDAVPVSRGLNPETTPIGEGVGANERRAMNAIDLPWETWRAVIAVLRAKGLTSMLEHTDLLEQQLDRHPPNQATVTLHLTDDVFLRSFDWARWQLETPLPDDASGSAHGGCR